MKNNLVILSFLVSTFLLASIGLGAQGLVEEVEENFMISLKYYSLDENNRLKVKKEIVFLSTPENFSTIQPLAKGYLKFSGGFKVHTRAKAASIFTLTYRIDLMEHVKVSDDLAALRTPLEKKTAQEEAQKTPPPPSYNCSGTINIIENKKTVFYSMKKPVSKSKMQIEFMLEITISKYKKPR